jgi:hypothetical protein
MNIPVLPDNTKKKSDRYAVHSEREEKGDLYVCLYTNIYVIIYCHTFVYIWIYI